MTDPWLTGTAFNGGWKQIVKSPSVEDVMSGVTHIYYTHEHPDHFSPKDFIELKKINPNVKVLIQNHKDKKLRNFFKKNNVQVMERSYRKILLGKSSWIKVFPWGVLDSFSLINLDGLKILNLNDCTIHSEFNLSYVKKMVGEVDVLLSQFSCGQYEGDESEPGRIIEASKQKLKSLSLQVRILSPKSLILSASYVYFSSKEYFYANKYNNNVKIAFDYLQKII